MNWTLFAAFVVAQVLAGWAFYRMGWARGNDAGDRAGYVRGRNAQSSAARVVERTDGLVRATPDDVDALFGPRPVTR